MEANEIKTMIGRIGKAAQKLSTQIQLCALECLIHTVKHGDVSLANNLIDAVGKGTRKATLYAWFEINGPFYLPKGKTQLAYDKTRADALKQEEEAALRERLEDILWTEAKPEPKPVSVFDVVSEFDKFMNRMNKLVKEPEVQVKHKDFLDALTEFSTKYNNEAAIQAIAALDPEEMAQMYGLKKINN